MSSIEKNWLIEHPQVRVAFDGYFPPYSYLNDDGKLEGFAVDLFGLLEQQLGIEFVKHPNHTWKTVYADAINRRVDIVATMVESGERKNWFLFTRPIIKKSLVLITRADDERFASLDDISGKAIALVEGYNANKKVLENYPNIEPRLVNTIPQALNEVALGNADALISFLGAAHYYRSKYLLGNLKYAFMFDQEGSNESIAIRNDWPILANIMDKTLASLPESTLLNLYNKWLNIEYDAIPRQITLSEEEKTWIKNHPVIRLGVDPEFAPFEFIERGQYQGMASDYIELLNQRLNLNMEVVLGFTWDEAVEKVKEKELDVLPAVAITQDRKTYLNFTQPYMNFQRVILTRSDMPLISGLDDLSGMKVAAQINSSHYGYLTENTDLLPIAFDTLQDGLMALSGGKVDAFIGNVTSTSYWVRRLNLTNIKIAAPASNEIQTLHFGIRNDWPTLQAILNKGLSSLSVNDHKKISEKWLAIKYDPKQDNSRLKLVALGSLVILGGFFLWNIQLNRKVRERTDQLMYSAHYDKLTELPNRFLILDRLSQRISEARQHLRKVAALSIDIDEFKKINDSLGHAAGDNLIREFGFRLAKLLKEGDTLGRLGGDQFLIVLCDCDEIDDAAIFAESIIKSLRQPFVLKDHEVSITASIGIATFPLDGSSPQDLLKHADSATHHSKDQGHGRYAFYTDQLNVNVSRRIELEGAMHDAITKQEIYVVYQPKVSAQTEKIIGFEALVRWKSAKLGDVSPAEFIPIAEKNGLIGVIGLFVLNSALQQLATLHKKFDDSLIMAVNISPAQCRFEHLVSDILEALNKNGVPKNRLELEITEGILLSESNHTSEFILKSFLVNGIRLAMDDFGTGYSSMSYLRKYKFDTLKIDREFIGDLDKKSAGHKLVSAIIGVAHSLDIDVVAEGVETVEQAKILKKLNCDVLQGWLYGKPMHPRQLESLLEAQYAEVEAQKA